MIAIALGTNQGDRQENLRRAKLELNEKGFQIQKESAVHETAAQLLPQGKEAWQMNYFNQVILGDYKKGPKDLLKDLKEIELRMGRKEKSNWAPRTIDLDILLFRDLYLEEKDLKIPHPGITNRNYFLSPLYELAPDIKIFDKNITDLKDNLLLKLPQWVGILNLSPDSFSDPFQKNEDLEKRITNLIEAKPHIIDVGAESTRPGAKALSHEEEWQRLKSDLPQILNRAHEQGIRVSIDTYHANTAKKAIEMGIDMVNDVSGLSEEMKEVAKMCDLPWVFMHNLGLPASKEQILSKEKDVIQQLKDWLNEKMNWIETRDNPNRFIFDPGVGFGKDAIQSREILKHFEEFKSYDLPLYIGHSRKSFLNGVVTKDTLKRDIATVSLSMDFMKRGVDYMRVHNISLHLEASLALQAIY